MVMKKQASRVLSRSARWYALGILTVVAGISASACGVDDKNLKHGTAGSGGSGGEGATGNVGATGNTSGTGANTNGGDDPGAPTTCKEGKKQCNGNTPQTCTEGVWVDGKECGGTEKVCTGEGKCAAYRLVNAGIDSFGVRPAEPVKGSDYVLKEQTLSAAPRTCAKGKNGYCVTGGIR